MQPRTRSDIIQTVHHELHVQELAEAAEQAPESTEAIAVEEANAAADLYEADTSTAATVAVQATVLAGPSVGADAAAATANDTGAASPSASPSSAAAQPESTETTDAAAEQHGAAEHDSTEEDTRAVGAGLAAVPKDPTEAHELPASYDPAALRPPPDKHQMDAAALQLTSVNHLVSSKRNNLVALDANTILTSAGNTAILYNPSTNEMVFLPGIDGGGVGAIALHPTEPLFVVAEQCKTRAPNAYIYRYLGECKTELYRVLRAGTERAYSAAAFSRDGKMLATVGAAPDYMLTLWDWESEATILRSKAFSQEVYNVEFSRHFPGLLYTHGTGHVRFWKMASTFTGLKLVGNLGKFGQVELSDVCAVLELPDGKMLSGTESGQLLLWDGGLIKVVLKRRGHAGCHDGNIEVLKHAASSNLIYSAGADGVIRMWDATKVRTENLFDEPACAHTSILSAKLHRAVRCLERARCQ